MKETLNFKNCYFVKNHDQVIDSLFTSKTTASGTYKRYKNFILLLNLQDEPIAHIQDNGIIGNARYLGKKIYRQCGLASTTESRYFPELASMKYSEASNYITSIYNSVE